MKKLPKEPITEEVVEKEEKVKKVKSDLFLKKQKKTQN